MRKIRLVLVCVVVAAAFVIQHYSVTGWEVAEPSWLVSADIKEVGNGGDYIVMKNYEAAFSGWHEKVGYSVLSC